jgi:uncharacterized membrane protein YccC
MMAAAFSKLRRKNSRAPADRSPLQCSRQTTVLAHAHASAADRAHFRLWRNASGSHDLAQAMRHLENAAEAIDLLLGREQRFSGILLPSVTSKNPRGYVVTALGAKLSLRSAIFRHALRVALGAAVGAAIMIKFDLPHGIWLPMTTLVVLQPEFGGTLSRAVQRTVGTAAGAVIAGLLLGGLHGTTEDRVMDRVAGAALGLIAGYLLWPQWERERLPAQFAKAIRANRDYMVQVFASLGSAELPSERIGEFRRQAEMASGNAEAGFQRMLSEPRIHRGRIARAFALVIYIQRLERHLIALATHLSGILLPEVELRALLGLLETAQEDIAEARCGGSHAAVLSILRR